MVISTKKTRVAALALLLALVVVACGPTERHVDAGSLIETFAFDAPGTFEEGQYQGAELRIVDGTYQIETENTGIIWGQAGMTHTDVMISVEGQSSTNDSHYGVMCRADPANNGDGYLFVISSAGSYLIARGEGDSYRFLVDGDAGSAMNRSGPNRIRAVCVGSYLALYVNDTFIASTEDSTYTSGLPALAANAGSSGPATATFGRLNVYNAQFAQ